MDSELEDKPPLSSLMAINALGFEKGLWSRDTRAYCRTLRQATTQSLQEEDTEQRVNSIFGRYEPKVSSVSKSLPRTKVMFSLQQSMASS
jgi:hypothetical protein